MDSFFDPHRDFSPFRDFGLDREFPKFSRESSPFADLKLHMRLNQRPSAHQYFGMDESTEEQQEAGTPSSRNDGLTEELRNFKEPKVHRIHIHVEGRDSPESEEFRAESTNSAGQEQVDSINAKNNCGLIDSKDSEQNVSPNTNEQSDQIDLANNVQDVNGMTQNYADAELTVEPSTDAVFEEKSVQDQACPSSDSLIMEDSCDAESYISNSSQDDMKNDSVTSGQKPKTTPTAEEVIENVMRATEAIEASVRAFKGCKSDREYLYLDEMLTRNLIKLDEVDPAGVETIRDSRRAAVRAVSQLIYDLETSANVNHTLDEAVTYTVSGEDEVKIAEGDDGSNAVDVIHDTVLIGEPINNDSKIPVPEVQMQA